MTNYLIQTHDMGSYYKITGIKEQPLNEIVDESLYKIVSLEDYTKIGKELMMNEIRLEKTSEVNVAFENLKITETEPLLIVKARCFTLCREALRSRLGVELLFDFFDFTNINNMFLSKGFNIVRDQEDTFFDIISSEDDSLKEKLGEYLELYDKINMHRDYFSKYESAKTAIQKSSTIEDAIKEQDLFLSIFN